MAREETESLIRDIAFKVLAERIGEPGTTRGEGKSGSFTIKAPLGGGTCRTEGKLDYILQSGLTLSHQWDILIERANRTWLGLELKHLSAVTDQFKCRSYDMLHLKQALGTKLCGVMVYVHVPGPNGISVARARAICYPFDHFLGIETRDPANLHTWLPVIVETVESILKGQTQDQSKASCTLNNV